MEAAMEKEYRELRNEIQEEETADVWREAYIGTYASEKSKGVYRFSVNIDNGCMTRPELLYEAHNAKWVSLAGDMLAFPTERQDRAGTCFVSLTDHGASLMGEILEEKDTPCFILQEGAFAYTANYHDGTVMIYHMGKEGPETAGRIENGAEAGCHQIILHGPYVMVPCLTQHRIRLFDRTDGFRSCGAVRFPDGSGPRHGVFNASHTLLYVVSEWSNELFIFEVKEDTFLLRQQLTILPEDTQSGRKKQVASAAAVRLTEDERFLYISIRGLDLLAVVDVGGSSAAVLQHVPCGGEHPRDFVLTEDERFLLVANRFSGEVVSLERDRMSGRILGIRSRISMPEGVSLAIRQGSGSMKEVI